MSETMSTPGGFVRADDRQESGTHYKEMTVQPWTLMEVLLTREEFIGFLKGNILKYGMRQGRKPGSDDGAKAVHYIQKLEEVTKGKDQAYWLNRYAKAQLNAMPVANKEEGWCNGG